MDKATRLPDFFIIGAAKCGTTDLASLLNEHPDIRISSIKEPTIFSRDDLQQHTEFFLDPHLAVWETLDWQSHRQTIISDYDRLFENAPAGILCGDASPSYIVSRRAPERIRELAPEAKLVVMLREPAGRLVSHYWFHVQQCRTCLPYDAYFYTKQATDAMRWGLYAEHLKHWLSVFPREQLHVILFEEYVSPRTRQGVVDGVCEFLGVEPTLDASQKSTFSNKTGVPRWLSLELALNMVRLRYRLPGTTAFEDRWAASRKQRLIHAIVNSISGINISYNRRPPAWPRDFMDRLRTYYRFENAELSGLIGRDVDAIWYGREEERAAANPAGPSAAQGAEEAAAAGSFTSQKVELAIPDRPFAAR